MRGVCNPKAVNQFEKKGSKQSAQSCFTIYNKLWIINCYRSFLRSFWNHSGFKDETPGTHNKDENNEGKSRVVALEGLPLPMRSENPFRALSVWSSTRCQNAEHIINGSFRKLRSSKTERLSESQCCLCKQHLNHNTLESFVVDSTDSALHTFGLQLTWLMRKLISALCWNQMVHQQTNLFTIAQNLLFGVFYNFTYIAL